MRDLKIPENARAAGYDSEQFVDLPCQDIFSGPVPKIRLSRLAEIAPGSVLSLGAEDKTVSLCSARLALAYAVTESRELIEEPPAPEPPPSPEPAPPAPPAPEIESLSKKILPSQEPPPVVNIENLKAASVTEVLPTPEKVTLPEKDALPSAKTFEPKIRPAAELPILAKNPNPKPVEAESAPTAPLVPPPPVIPLPASAPAPEAKKPFSLFPMFRRKEPLEIPPPAVKPSLETTRNRIEIPKPRRPFLPLTGSPVSPTPQAGSEEAEKTPPVTEPAPDLSKMAPAEATVIEKALAKPPIVPPVEEKTPPADSTPTPTPTPTLSPSPSPSLSPAPAPEITPPEPPVSLAEAPVAEPEPFRPARPKVAAEEFSSALVIEPEHLPRGEAKPEIGDQDGLQAVFLTEEFLSVDRVLELSGNLPGIKSCILAKGGTVIASHNTPDSVDIVSLSAHALEMLKAMRASAAKMGVGAVPAVTIHSEKGPITFFHEDDLCLLVLHKDRGFVPGVREKLQQVMVELSQAKLPLPVGKKALGLRE